MSPKGLLKRWQSRIGKSHLLLSLFLTIVYLNSVWLVYLSRISDVPVSPPSAGGNPGNDPIVTYVANPSYILGACVLSSSIRRSLPASDLPPLIAVTSSPALTSSLSSCGWTPLIVDHIPNPYSHSSPHQANVFTKLSIFSLPFAKLLYIDADCLVLPSSATPHLLASLLTGSSPET